MKFVTVDGKAAVLHNGLIYDIAHISEGMFSEHMRENLERYQAFIQWAQWQVKCDFSGEHGQQFTVKDCDAPIADPRQVFGIALNYHDHIAETHMEVSDVPLYFSKFPSAIGASYGNLQLSSEYVDWEGELVVVIGEGGRNIPESQALSKVAGFTIGQDYSDRHVQRQGKKPQYSLAKSFAGYAPIGPWIVTLDEFTDPHDLLITTKINGELKQQGSTRLMIRSVEKQIAYLSSIVELYPGDLIFTGTPSGTGIGHEPPQFLRPGDVVETSITGIGTMEHHCI